MIELKKLSEVELYNQFVSDHDHEESPDDSCNLCVEIIKRGLWFEFTIRKNQEWTELKARNDQELVDGMFGDELEEDLVIN